MKVIELKKLDEIATLRGDWEGILNKQKGKTIHHTFDWIFLLYKHFGNERSNAFYVIDEGGRPVGFIPLVRNVWRTGRIFPVRQLSFIGEREGATDFCDLITGENLDVLQYFFNLITTVGKWDRIHLKYLTQGLSHIEEVRRALDASKLISEWTVCTRNLHIKTADFGGWEGYWSHLGRNLRRDITKKVNRMKKKKGFLYERNSSLSAAKMIDIFDALHTPRQTELSRKSFFRHTKNRAFVEEAIDLFREKGQLDYSIIWLEDRPVSYTLGFIYDNVYYHWSIGFHGEYAHLSPNKIHHRFLIEDCFKDGLAEFNFMRGVSEYKEKWTDDYRLSHQVKIMNRSSLYSRVVFSLKDLAGCLRKSEGHGN